MKIRKLTPKRPDGVGIRRWKIIVAQNYIRGRVLIGTPKIVSDDFGNGYVVYGYQLLKEVFKKNGHQMLKDVFKRHPWYE